MVPTACAAGGGEVAAEAENRGVSRTFVLPGIAAKA